MGPGDRPSSLITEPVIVQGKRQPTHWEEWEGKECGLEPCVGENVDLVPASFSRAATHFTSRRERGESVSEPGDQHRTTPTPSSQPPPQRVRPEQQKLSPEHE